MKHTKEVKALNRALKEYYSSRKRVILEAMTQPVSNFLDCLTYMLPTGYIYYRNGRVYYYSKNTRVVYKLSYK